MARKNRQLAAYLPKEGNSFRGNVLVVKVDDFSGAEDIEESEIKDKALVISWVQRLRDNLGQFWLTLYYRALMKEKLMRG